MAQPYTDLRSDTVNKPTESMYAAMNRAELGDDGWRDDPTVHELERVSAAMLGKEAALFVPGGTMANLVAFMSHRGAGGEILGETRSHFAITELGGVASIAGLSFRPIRGRRGAMDIDALSAAIRPESSTRGVRTALICVENTHTAESGAVLPLEHMAAVKKVAESNGVPVFLDGARIFNAALVLGVEAKEIAHHADSVAISLYKSLGAPGGSLLAGSADLIQQALVYRKMLGGAMRQAGLLAACGLVALREMIDRLADDHASAKKIAVALQELDEGLIDPADVETNLLTADVRHTGWTAENWAAALKERGVLVAPLPPWQLRLITHRDIDSAAVDRALAAFRDVLARTPAYATMRKQRNQRYNQQ